MKTNSELLLDIIHRKKKNLQMYIEELQNSLDDMDQNNAFFYEGELVSKKEEISFLDNLLDYVSEDSNSGIECLKNYIKVNKLKNESSYVRAIISKENLIKDLLKEYKIEYKKNYSNNKYLGLNGVFDKDLFCGIIQKRIDKCIFCNRVTREKYKHLAAFLTELLHEIESSENPLMTLKHKMKIYKKYKNTEYVEIRKNRVSKLEIVKEILEEYKKEKKINIGCK